MKITGHAGDYVKIGLAQREVEGVMLESYDSSVVLLKLASGYNIGIPKENIHAFRVLRKFTEKEKDFKIPSGKGKPTIGLIVAGGTISSKLDPAMGSVKPLTELREFAQFYPALFERVHVKEIAVPFMTLSANMDATHWVKIAEAAEKMLADPEISGIIITHGTDTLHYTSAALSFMLRDLNKPVVLTYSQRSIDRASSDADLNLRCAAEFALSDCAEVVLVGHASMNDDFCYALPGAKVRKMHSSRRDAFQAINTQPLAKIWPDRVEFLKGYRPRNKEKPNIDTSFNAKIGLVKFHPGQKPDILDHYRDNGHKGIILELYGLGNLPSADTSHSWIPKLKKMISDGFVVCATAQTIHGRLNPRVYSTGRGLIDIGVIHLEDMLSETAFVKLGWALGHRGWKLEKIKEMMLANVAGELNELISV